MRMVLLIAAAGAAGTVSRYLLVLMVNSLFGSHFPWGTFVVNIFGSFLFGFVWTLSDRQINITPEQSMIILVGFMGAFTTFSTFSFDTGNMIRSAQWLPAMANVGFSVCIGVAALFAGHAVAHRL